MGEKTEKTKILIVDDNDGFLTMLEMQLRGRGYDVIVSEDGQINAGELDGIDLALLDIELKSVMNGFDFIPRFLERGIPVIIITGYSDHKNYAMAMSAGASDFIMKSSLDIQDLSNRINNAIQRAITPSAAALNATTAPITWVAPNPEILYAWDVAIDIDAREVWKVDSDRKRTRRIRGVAHKVFDLLVYFVREQGRALSRNDILNAVWGEDAVVSSNVVDQNVHSIRKKLDWSDKRLCAVNRVGYKLEKDL